MAETHKPNQRRENKQKNSTNTAHLLTSFWLPGPETGGAEGVRKGRGTEETEAEMEDEEETEGEADDDSTEDENEGDEATTRESVCVCCPVSSISIEREVAADDAGIVVDAENWCRGWKWRGR